MMSIASMRPGHEQSRKRVCGVCFRKPKNYQSISPLVLDLINKHSYKDYSIEDISLPTIVCMSCVKTLKVIDSDKVNRKLPDIDYMSLVKPKNVNTRSSENEKCCCSICTIARLNGREYLEYEKGQREKQGRPTQKMTTASTSKQICSVYFSEIGHGIPHECTNRVTQENLIGLIQTQSEKSQEQITSKMLEVISEEKGVSKQGGPTMLAH